MQTHRGATIAGLALAVTTLGGCASPDAGSARAADDGPLVLASFYPLQYVVEQIGGDMVQVANLTPPGTEPHDVELSPRQVREVGDADLVVALTGFQPAVDEALAARTPQRVLDAAENSAVAAHASGEESAKSSAASAASADAAPAHESVDPHFWLDPTLLAAVGHDVAEELSEIDPDQASASVPVRQTSRSSSSHWMSGLPLASPTAGPG